MVTGIRFCVRTLHRLIGAPANMPAGRRNMFATECSKPMATNMEIGNQMPTILPARSFAEVARKTAMQTSQLHMMALTTVCQNDALHFVTTVLAASLAVPMVSKPV